MVPILALVAVLLIGATAIAVDLSMNTHTRRSLQNVSDSSALAGARELGVTDATTAVTRALDNIGTNMGFPPAWYGSPSNHCSAVGRCVSLTFSGVSVAVNSPPQQNPLGDTHSIAYIGNPLAIEVNLHEQSANGFGSVIGFAKSTEGSHSVAYHLPNGTSFGFALYSRTLVESGNQVEVIKGDVYVDRLIAIQSSGLGGVCSDLDASGRSGGHIMYGFPQLTQSGYANDGQSSDTHYTNVQQTGSCSSAPTGLNEVANGCPPSIGAVSAQLVFLGLPTLGACTLNPPPQPPALTEPTLDNTSRAGCAPNRGGSAYLPGKYQCTTGRSAIKSMSGTTFGPGVYDIKHSGGCDPTNCYDVEITGSVGATFDLSGVTFVLEPGATIGIDGKVSVTWSGAGSTNLPLYAVPTTPVPASTQCQTDALSSSPPNLESGLYIVGNGTTVTVSGTIFMPTGKVDEVTQGSLKINPGQAVAEEWCVQSGNHPNPEITYNAASTAPAAEVLQLVE